MQRLIRPITSTLAGIAVMFSVATTAQPSEQPLFLSLTPPDGLPIIPIMEGWVANPDGTVTHSFGAINRNKEAVDIPLGEANYIEPAEFNGMQPTHFPSGRSTGIFAVTVPAAQKETDVWWHIKTGDEETLKVPGRFGTPAYELDFIRPRPQGSMQPLIGAGESGDAAPGLFAGISDFPGNVTAGTPVAISVNVNDPSIRDSSDDRFQEPIDMAVRFNKYQGPGRVEFARHESTPEPVNPYKEDDRRFNFYREPPLREVTVKGGSGVATVYATFSQPGEYIIHSKVSNFRAPDSSDGDQCCWSNYYQRVTVR